MKHLLVASVLMFASVPALAAGQLNCKAGGTGVGAGGLSAKISPTFIVGESEVLVDLVQTGFDALTTTAEAPFFKRRATCVGSWEETVRLPYYGRLVGIEYEVSSATFDFLETVAPATEQESMKIMNADLYVKGFAKVNGQVDVFEKKLKLPASQDINEAKANNRTLFPLQLNNQKRTMRENNSVCGTDITVHLDEITGNIQKNDKFAFASASVVVPFIRLVFIPVDPSDPECVNRPVPLSATSAILPPLEQLPSGIFLDLLPRR